MELVVCELARRGKLLVGDPFFEGGVPLVVDRKGAGEAAVGDLVVAASGPGPRPAWSACWAAPRRSRSSSRDCSGTSACGAPSRRFPPSRPRTSRSASTCATCHAFTIDPDTAKDFDDALSLRREGDGLRAWVHIADVSAYVPPGSPLDRDAAERAFSVYVPGLVEPMLPERLSNDLCSLRPDVDRRCVTVEVPFDGELRAGEPIFYRSMIRSRERLTYGQAEAILAGREQASEATAETLELAERLSRGAARVAASPAARCRSRPASRRSSSTARAASSAPGSRPSRTRTRWSRS